MRTPACSTLPLVASILLAPFVAGQANRTVDDFAPQIVYSPASAVTHLNTTGFNSTELYNGTIGVLDTTTVDAVNMTLRFTGSGIWLFIAKPQTSDDDGDFVTAYTIYLDGEDVSESVSVDAQSDAEYGDVAFSNATLKPGQHTIILSATDTVYFDYAVFTSEESTPETLIPPVQSPTSSSVSGTTSKSTSAAGSAGSNTDSSPSVSTTARKHSTNHIPIIAGVTAAVVVLFIPGVIVFFCVRQRRRAQQRQRLAVTRSDLAQRPTPPSNPVSYGVQERPPYVAYSTSNTGLLRAPTVYSSSGASSSDHEHALSPTATSPSQYSTSDFQHGFHGDPRTLAHSQSSPYAPSIPLEPQRLRPQSQRSHASGYATDVDRTTDFDQRMLATSGAVTLEPQLRRPPLLQSQTSGVLRMRYDNADADADAEFQRMMEEQRAVVAEHTPPAAWVVVDEKKAPRGSQDREQGSRVAAHAPSASSARSPNTAQVDMSNIAAEMRALREQVARLEVQGGVLAAPQHRREFSDDMPPPAYD